MLPLPRSSLVIKMRQAIWKSSQLLGVSSGKESSLECGEQHAVCCGARQTLEELKTDAVPRDVVYGWDRPDQVFNRG